MDEMLIASNVALWVGLILLAGLLWLAYATANQLLANQGRALEAAHG